MRGEGCDTRRRVDSRHGSDTIDWSLFMRDDVFAEGMDVVRTFLSLKSLLTVLVVFPSAGWSASDSRLVPPASRPQVAVQLAAEAPRSGPAVFDPAAIAAALDKRSRGQAEPLDPKLRWMTSFREQLNRCWKPSSGALQLDVEINLRRDGTLAGEPVVVRQSDAVDHPEAVASVLKAIKSCVPFRLPPEHYASWRTIETTFDGSTR